MKFHLLVARDLDAGMRSLVPSAPVGSRANMNSLGKNIKVLSLSGIEPQFLDLTVRSFVYVTVHTWLDDAVTSQVSTGDLPSEAAYVIQGTRQKV